MTPAVGLVLEGAYAGTANKFDGLASSSAAIAAIAFRRRSDPLAPSRARS